MRLNFVSDEKPKKLAKEILNISGSVRLADCQQSLARAAGYRDWHDLANNCANLTGNNALFSLNNDEAKIEFILAISNDTGANAGRLIALLARAKVLDIGSFSDALRLRETIFARTEFKSPGKRQPGEIGRTKIEGEKSQNVIFKEFSSGTTVISNKGTRFPIADFEYVSPRSSKKFFLPMWTYLPYGQWTLRDGSIVLFSREYCPMWKIVIGRAPERLHPAAWIKFEEEKFFWEGIKMPWSNHDIYSQEMNRMDQLGIRCLPQLVEFLPALVFQQHVRSERAVKDLEVGAPLFGSVPS